MRELFIKNLKVVSGSFGPVGAAVGAAVSSTGYLAERMAAGEDAHLEDLAAAASMGAAAGFFSGPLGSTALRTGAAAIVGVNVAGYSGIAVGSVERMVKENRRDRAGINYCGTDYQ